jgi:hypothetical protein
MRVLTLLLRHAQVERVKAANPAPNSVSVVWSLADARNVLTREPIDVLVTDPIGGGSNPAIGGDHALHSIAEEFPYLPIVFYVSNPAKSLHLIARFPTKERCEAVIVDLDDSPVQLAAALNSAIDASLVGQLMQVIAPRLIGEPANVVHAIRHLFTNPSLYRTVDDIAVRACMSRRTFDRLLHCRGLTTGSQLLKAARVLRWTRMTRDMSMRRNLVNAAFGGGTRNEATVLAAGWEGQQSDAALDDTDSALLARVSMRILQPRE